MAWDYGIWQITYRTQLTTIVALREEIQWDNKLVKNGFIFIAFQNDKYGDTHTPLQF